MVVRNIVEINEVLCNGCGECIPNCAEGALQIVEGKARIVKDMYCDGLGACLGHCPQDAISIIQREADEFDEEAVHEFLARRDADEHHEAEEQGSEVAAGFGCTSGQVQQLEAAAPKESVGGSALSHWPVQLNLVPVKAPFFDDADLLVVADCVPVAFPDLHAKLLRGRPIVIGCPKFDDAQGYAERLGEILRLNSVRTVTVVHMEVPCCSSMKGVVDYAVRASGRPVPVMRATVSVRGEIY
jgi:Pyruvate/2-oxoacid:ferredoxin oxidoreductase delta subunit